jgi:hypothetical protein
MLDVHPPHEAAHTWKDFFIHIATICVGLLIAIGLEQSVEALHHRHQRRDLEEQMRTEAEHNLALVYTNIDRLRGRLAFTDAYIVALNQAPVVNGRIQLKHLPERGKAFDIGITQPSQTVWAVAKTSGTVALLPEEEAQVYARLDYEAEILDNDRDFDHAGMKFASFKLARQGQAPEQFPSLTLAERDALLETFSNISAQHRTRIILELNEAGACRGVLHGARSVDEMIHYMLDEIQLAKSKQMIPQL